MKNGDSCNASTTSIGPQKSACPYKMSDGRNFTDYRPSCTIAYQKKQNNSFKSNYEQRQYLIKNANSIISQQQKYAEDMNNCSGCYKPTEVGTMLQEKNMVKCNNKTCEFYESDLNGIGTGRNYASA